MDKPYRKIWAGLFVSAVMLAIVFGDGRIDHSITSLFYSPHAGTFPLRESKFVDVFLYRGMKLFMGGVFVAYLAWGLWALKTKRQGFTARHLWVAVAGTGIIIGLVNLIKSLTGVECPWSTQPFGGQADARSLVEAFTGLLSGNAGHGRCFPAGHATGGLFLFAWAVALRDSAPLAAKFTAGLGLILGLFMGLTRVTQGAHFLSHVLWSMWVAALIGVLLTLWLDSSKRRALI